MQFPRLVYKSASEHVLVSTAEEYNVAIAAGWYGTVPEALAGKKSVAVAPPTKQVEDLGTGQVNAKPPKAPKVVAPPAAPPATPPAVPEGGSTAPPWA